jgi:hypothetical protein
MQPIENLYTGDFYWQLYGQLENQMEDEKSQ